MSNHPPCYRQRVRHAATSFRLVNTHTLRKQAYSMKYIVFYARSKLDAQLRQETHHSTWHEHCCGLERNLNRQTRGLGPEPCHWTIRGHNGSHTRSLQSWACSTANQGPNGNHASQTTKAQREMEGTEKGTHGTTSMWYLTAIHLGTRRKTTPLAAYERATCFDRRTPHARWRPASAPAQQHPLPCRLISSVHSAERHMNARNP